MNVLLVEDDQDQALLFSEFLQRVPGAHKLTHLEDGKSAAEYFSISENLKNTDVIFLDLNLPMVGGAENLKLFSKSFKKFNLPIIIMTSSASESDRILTEKYNIEKYLIKPIGLALLCDVFAELGSKGSV